MESKEAIVLIDEIRSKLYDLMNHTDVPALYECYKMADMNLHWSKWLQGDVEEIFPELEYEIHS
jgi:hypothetical protein